MSKRELQIENAKCKIEKKEKVENGWHRERVVPLEK